MEEYILWPLIKNGKLLAEIRTGMYGLPQAGQLAYIKLIKHLAADGYLSTGNMPGLFRHITRPTIFNLVVDDLSMIYPTVSPKREQSFNMRGTQETTTLASPIRCPSVWQNAPICFTDRVHLPINSERTTFLPSLL